MNWRYMLNGQTVGPVDLTTLQTLINNGTISRETLVQPEGFDEWAPARTISDLRFPEPSTPKGQGTLPPPLPGPGVVDSEADDIEKNKIFAILAYIGLLFLVPLLAAPNSKFARYHTNQGIVLLLATIILGMGSLILAMIPIISCVMFIAPFIVGTGSIILMIIGIINAAAGHYKPLPLIGHFQILK